MKGMQGRMICVTCDGTGILLSKRTVPIDTFDTVNRKMTRIRKLKTKYGPSFILELVLLCIWQAAAEAVGKTHILPGPVQILLRTWELRESLLLHHLPATMLTIITGWLLSVTIGILLAVIMNASRYAEALLHMPLIITQTIPVMCISPLFVVWFGYTLPARLTAVVLSTFFAITLNTYEGLSSADPQKKELLRTFGAGRLQIFLQLEVPSAYPRLITALKMTAPWVVIDAAVAEWLGATEGLGYFSKRMISKMDGAAVFAPLLILCIIAFTGMALLRAAEKRTAAYRNEL